MSFFLPHSRSSASRATHLILAIFLWASFSCGSDARYFIGEYAVSPIERITECSGGEPDATSLASISSITISSGDDSDIVVMVASCLLDASVSSEELFEISEQSCTLGADPSIKLVVQGEGSVLEQQLSLALDGTYSTSIYGYPVNCNYSFSVQ